MSLRLVRDTWEKLGRRDPYWAILTHEDKRDGGWKPEDFFATGETEIQKAMGRVDELAPDLRRGRALDFGCGVGRLSQALARRFDAVDGVDVAASMLELAKKHDEHSVRYHQNDAPNLRLFRDKSFDFVYTTIVLQHMERHLQQAYVREFARVLRPGGVLYFQLACEPRRNLAGHSPLRLYVRGLRRRAFLFFNRTLRGKAYMDMHGTPREQVESWIREGGLELLEAEQDDSAGPLWISYRYVAQKPGN